MSRALQACDVPPEEPFCQEVGQKLIIVAESSVDVGKDDGKEFAIQEALLEAKSKLANLAKTTDCISRNCGARVGPKFDCWQGEPSSVAKFTLGDLEWVVSCESATRVVVRVWRQI